MATNSGTLKSVSLAPGECIVLPAGAVIDSVIVTGDAAATSTCGVLPTPSSYKCGYFALFLDSETGDNKPLDESSTYCTSVKVGATTYMINEKIIASGENPGTPISAGTLNLHITDLPIFEFMAVAQTALTDRQLIWIYFQTPETLYDSLEMKISDRGTYYYLKPNDAECGDYPNPS